LVMISLFDWSLSSKAWE